MVAERLADFSNALHQAVVGDGNIGPYRLPQLVPACQHCLDL